MDKDVKDLIQAMIDHLNELNNYDNVDSVWEGIDEKLNDPSGGQKRIAAFDKLNKMMKE